MHFEVLTISTYTVYTLLVDSHSNIYFLFVDQDLGSTWISKSMPEGSSGRLRGDVRGSRRSGRFAKSNLKHFEKDYVVNVHDEDIDSVSSSSPETLNRKSKKRKEYGGSSDLVENKSKGSKYFVQGAGVSSGGWDVSILQQNVDEDSLSSSSNEESKVAPKKKARKKSYNDDNDEYVDSCQPSRGIDDTNSGTNNSSTRELKDNFIESCAGQKARPSTRSSTSSKLQKFSTPEMTSQSRPSRNLRSSGRQEKLKDTYVRNKEKIDLDKAVQNSLLDTDSHRNRDIRDYEVDRVASSISVTSSSSPSSRHLTESVSNRTDFNKKNSPGEVPSSTTSTHKTESSPFSFSAAVKSGYEAMISPFSSSTRNKAYSSQDQVQDLVSDNDDIDDEGDILTRTRTSHDVLGKFGDDMNKESDDHQASAIRATNALRDRDIPYQSKGSISDMMRVDTGMSRICKNVSNDSEQLSHVPQTEESTEMQLSYDGMSKCQNYDADDTDNDDGEESPKIDEPDHDEHKDCDDNAYPAVHVNASYKLNYSPTPEPECEDTELGSPVELSCNSIDNPATSGTNELEEVIDLT